MKTPFSLENEVYLLLHKIRICPTTGEYVVFLLLLLHCHHRLQYFRRILWEKMFNYFFLFTQHICKTFILKISLLIKQSVSFY